MSSVRWTCLSTSHLGDALTRQGHALSPRSVGRLLNEEHYSLQGNRKTQEGGTHPDRNAQFEHINTTVDVLQDRGQPVISVDAKKKELEGQFKNVGRECGTQGAPHEAKLQDVVGE